MPPRAHSGSGGGGWRRTLKDPSLSLRCVNKQSVLLIFSRACPAAAAPALLVVTAEPWQFKSVGIVLPADAVCSMWVCVRVCVCFLPSAAVGKKKIAVSLICEGERCGDGG